MRGPSYFAMHLTRIVQNVSDALLTLAYPQVCTICGDSVEYRRFGVCCENCWLTTRIFNHSDLSCWKCGLVSLNTPAHRVDEPRYCHKCDLHPFASARSIGFYDRALRETVLSLKREPHLPRFVAEHLAEFVKRPPLNSSSVIVPVPLHQTRLKSRGFNQADVVAGMVAGVCGLPIVDKALVRTAHSEKYRAGLDAKGRQDTVTKSFAVRYEQLIAGDDVLLVDDVYTTGATVAACTEELLLAGAQSVSILTIARSYL
jgi:ComF family protein